MSLWAARRPVTHTAAPSRARFSGSILRMRQHVLRASMLRKMDDIPCALTNSSRDAVSGKKDTKSRLRYLLRVRSMRSYVSGNNRPGVERDQPHRQVVLGDEVGQCLVLQSQRRREDDLFWVLLAKLTQGRDGIRADVEGWTYLEDTSENRNSYQSCRKKKKGLRNGGRLVSLAPRPNRPTTVAPTRRGWRRAPPTSSGSSRKWLRCNRGTVRRSAG